MGAAGLVGQNLALLFSETTQFECVAIDKHLSNLQLLKSINPRVTISCADLSHLGDWQSSVRGADVVVMLHAQIGGLDPDVFVQNNVTATQHVLDAVKLYEVPFVVQISSSVVHSAAQDNYTKTKKAQEALFRASGVTGCVLRPTLMYGWFDPKHFGWLARFMEKVPVFPIPGDGKYMRQPLYNRDFCRAIVWCCQNRPAGKTYDLVGQEHVDYIDIIRAIRRVKKLKTPIMCTPVWLFKLLLRVYGLFTKQPPFTAAQLDSLAAGDDFTGVDIEATFGFKPTTLEDGLTQTFCDERYARYVVER